jgi:DNA/RNA endonuclease YhcR with UshA esterase domain
MTETIRPSGQCPSCRRFVGPYARCPYCGADVGQRMAVRVFKVGSLVLAILGVAVLLFAATRSEPPTVDVGSLRGTMNWAYVRVEGMVTRQPAFDPQTRNLTLWVSDGTGEIMVLAYRSEAEALLGGDLVPVMGDSVTLEGTLRIREDFQYLVLNVPDNMEVRPVDPAEMTIAAVGARPLYEKVKVQGVIRDARVPYEGLRILTLRDATGEIDVTVPTGDVALSGDLPDLGTGQSVSVEGAVDQYRGTPQISLGRGSDLVVLDEAVAIAPERCMGELSTADLGSMATVEGTISRVNTFSSGTRYTLDDGTGTITLLLWQDLAASLPDHDALTEDALLRVRGVIKEYGGDLEVVPELPSDLLVLASPERVIPERQLGELNDASIGRTVGVEGALTSLRTFSVGVKGTLDDGTGTVTLLLWQDLYENHPDAASLVPGAILRVEGEIRDYRGEREVVPQVPADVTVVGRIELLPEAPIGQITVDDLGQTVQITGRITEVIPFSAGMKYRVDDGTGIILLLLWQDVYDRLEAPAALAVGTEVSIRGRVEEYQGELEVVPQAQADVEIVAVAEVTPTLTMEAGDMPELAPTPTGFPTLTTPQSTDQPALPPTPTPTTAPTSASTPKASIETRTIGAISRADVGAMLKIAIAGIADISYFSAGVKYTLTDATGSIILLLWQNVLEDLPDRYDLSAGSQVRVTGRIEEYQGELEIIPRNASGVRIVDPGARLPIEKRAVSDITPSDEGRVFIIKGTVARTEVHDWIYLWIHDGTGEILIYVPERVVQYMPAGIVAGTQLRVTGEVDVYKGVLEIIPLAGADVEVR